jgi:hypothetical protein
LAISRRFVDTVLCCALLAAFTGGFAQLTFAQVEPPRPDDGSSIAKRSIEGTVLSQSGAPIAGAVVLLKDTKTLQIRSYIANKKGQYRFFGLSSDINYELRAESNGMTSKTKMISVFDSHKVVHLNLKLRKRFKA